MSIRMEACFPTMYTWAQTHTYRCDPGGPKGRQIQSHQISPLTLDVSIFKQLPWTDAWMAHTHTRTQPALCSRSCGTRGVLEGFHLESLLPWWPLWSSSPMGQQALHNFPLKRTHTNSRPLPRTRPQTHTQFSPPSALYGGAGRGASVWLKPSATESKRTEQLTVKLARAFEREVADERKLTARQRKPWSQKSAADVIVLSHRATWLSVIRV